MKDFSECPTEGEDRIFEKIRSKEQVRRVITPKKGTGENFRAKFGNKYTSTICTDTCADDNMIDGHTISVLLKLDVECKLEDLPKQRIFKKADNLPNGASATIVEVL